MKALRFSLGVTQVDRIGLRRDGEGGAQILMSEMDLRVMRRRRTQRRFVDVVKEDKGDCW